MDNRRIDLCLEWRGDFELAMKIAVAHRTTVGYRLIDNTLILYWAMSDKAAPLPYEMGAVETTNFVWGWLEKNAPLGRQPDHDGDNGKGFRIYNESWGHVGGEYQAFIAITLIWAMYGK
jgi:hypothetical protein